MRISQEDTWKKMNRLYKEMEDIYHKLALKSGISDSAHCILYVVATVGDGCVQKDISEYYSMSKQTINTSVKNLQEKGYLDLVKGKGRDKHMHLTEKGRQFVERYIIPVVEIENEVLEEMGPEERTQLLRLSEKYIRILQDKANALEI